MPSTRPAMPRRYRTSSRARTTSRARTSARTGSLTLPAALLLALSACGDEAGSVSFDVSVTDSAGVQMVAYPGAVTDVEAPFTLEDAPTVRIGVLDGDEARQFSRVIGAYRTSDGDFVVVDGQGPPLRRFDSDGTLLHTAGSRGEGPGELSASRAIFPTDDGGTRIWDQRTQRLVQIDREGRTLHDVPAMPGLPGQSMHLAVAPSSLDSSPPHILAIAERSPGMSSAMESGVFANEAALLLRTGTDTASGTEAAPDTLATFPGGETELRMETSGDMIAVMMASPWFRARTLTAPTADALWFSRGTEWEIHRYGTEGLGSVVRIDGEIAPLGAEFRDSLLQNLLDGVQSREAEIRIRDAHREREWPETLPPIRALFADDAGRLWLGVGDPERGIASGGGPSPGSERFLRDWLLLANDGTEVVGRLSLPPRSRPLYADEEGVLLEAHDELDVPFIEWWQFRNR